MRDCPYCGAQVSDEDVFCGECGARVPGGAAVGLEPDTVVTDVAPAGKAAAGRRSLLPFVVIGAAAVLVVLIACGVLALILAGRSGSTDGPTFLGGSPVPPVTKAQRVSGPASEPVFEETFADNSREWGVWEDEHGEKGVGDGVYFITVTDVEWASWGTSESYTFDDFVVQVEGQAVHGPDDNGYGLVFRYQDSENFYYYEVSSDGYYSIGKMVADEWETLVRWTESDSIRLGRRTNTLRVECRGPQMTFLVNDYLIEELTDHSYDSGALGLMAEAGDDPGVRVHFDDLKVWTVD